MIGDALYANRKICSISEGYGIKPYFLLKTNATFRAKGVQSWKRMLCDFADNTQEWLEKYHVRSISESVNSMKKTEEILKINMHNLSSTAT